MIPEHGQKALVDREFLEIVAAVKSFQNNSYVVQRRFGQLLLEPPQVGRTTDTPRNQKDRIALGEVKGWRDVHDQSTRSTLCSYRVDQFFPMADPPYWILTAYVRYFELRDRYFRRMFTKGILIPENDSDWHEISAEEEGLG
jgi:hypothetical protein